MAEARPGKPLRRRRAVLHPSETSVLMKFAPLTLRWRRMNPLVLARTSARTVKMVCNARATVEQIFITVHLGLPIEVGLPSYRHLPGFAPNPVKLMRMGPRFAYAQPTVKATSSRTGRSPLHGSTLRATCHFCFSVILRLVAEYARYGGLLTFSYCPSLVDNRRWTLATRSMFSCSTAMIRGRIPSGNR